MLRDNGSYNGLSGFSPEKIQAIIARYEAWSGKLRERGKLLGQNKLRDREGRVMTRKGSNVAVTDGPFAEVKEIIGGYFLLEAKNYDEALSLANDCPHLDFGSIEVREIEPMP
jgi:hypothetical protein